MGMDGNMELDTNQCGTFLENLEKKRKLIQLRGGPPWGFRMCGGKDTNMALKIARVNPESKAARYGIREGDLVTGINGENVDHLTNADVQKLLKKGGPSISIELKSAKRVNAGERVVIDDLDEVYYFI